MHRSVFMGSLRVVGLLALASAAAWVPASEPADTQAIPNDEDIISLARCSVGARFSMRFFARSLSPRPLSVLSSLLSPLPQTAGGTAGAVGTG